MITCRLMTPEDVGDVVDILGDAYGPDIKPLAQQELMQWPHPGLKMFVGEVESQVICCGGLVPNSFGLGGHMLAWVATTPAHQGKGYGKAIVQFICKNGNTSDDSSTDYSIVLTTESQNTKFYEPLGFQKSGDLHADNVVMVWRKA